LNNIIKHSKASRVDVKLSYDNASTVIEVRDDGLGFDVHSISERGSAGSGLKNMRTRSTLIGGELNVISEPGAGTSICLQLRTSAGTNFE